MSFLRSALFLLIKCAAKRTVPQWPRTTLAHRPLCWVQSRVAGLQRDTRARRRGAGGGAVPWAMPSRCMQVPTVTSTRRQGPHGALPRMHLCAPGRGTVTVLLVSSIRVVRNAREGGHGSQTWKKSTINKSAPPSEGPLSISCRRSTKMCSTGLSLSADSLSVGLIIIFIPNPKVPVYRPACNWQNKHHGAESSNQ